MRKENKNLPCSTAFIFVEERVMRMGKVAASPVSSNPGLTALKAAGAVATSADMVVYL